MKKIFSEKHEMYTWTCPECDTIQGDALDAADFDSQGESFQSCENCETDFTVCRPDDQ